MSEVNGGSSVQFVYDNDGLTTSAGSLGLTWDSTNGSLNSTSLGIVSTAHSHNAFGELQSNTASIGGSQTLSVSFERDKLGRVSKKTESIQGETHIYDYAYDARGRLTEVTKDGALLADYDYDANGNRTAVTTSSGTVSANYDAQDRLTNFGGNSYTYTENGELAAKSTPAGTTTYVYDELDNLTSVNLANGNQINYLVDPRGRRVGKKVNGVSVQRLMYGSRSRANS